MKNAYFQTACNVLMFAYGMMILFRRGADGLFIFCMLISVAAAFGSAIPESPDRSAAVSAAYLVFCLLVPRGLPFVPFVLYEPFRRKRYLVVLLAAAAAAIHFSGPENLTFLLIGTGIAFLFAAGTYELEERSKSLIDIRDRAAERSMELEHRNKTLREQQDNEIYTATLRERNRIAREIHDSVGHILSRSILMNGALKTINHDEGMGEPLAMLETQLSQAMNAIRESVHDLHDESVDLNGSAELLIRDFRKCPVTFTFDMTRIVPKDVKYCFLSVLKEALTNVERHSNATQVQVSMVEHPAIYQLTIQDNGTDIDRERFTGMRNSGEGIGLLNMRERVRMLRGTISVTGEAGFRIFISIPKKTQQMEEIEMDSQEKGEKDR
jgi:signal transduction histidine kinase